MKQVLQNLKSGETLLEEVPCPRVARGQILIRTVRSLVSSGTERMLVDFGKANILDKARQQPDKVRMVVDKVKTDGLIPTIEAVKSKLDQPLPMGYCNVGTVIDAGAGVTEFQVGDRVASNGKHAEMVSVPSNLCAKIPASVSDDSAVFTVIGAIALQGIRLIQPTLGEAVVVTGLGLIGLMTVQLLRTNGCRVLGIDMDPTKLALAAEFGADTVHIRKGEDPVRAAMAFSRNRGVDAVVITASTKSSEPVHQAASMSRKRGRIVLVGVTGLELSRADFYEKELSFQVSCSYGPGRYDPVYEEMGQDYPVGFVRWTEQRNFEAVLDMLATGRLDPEPLISHRFSLARAQEAYKIVAGSEASLGILLEYPDAAAKTDQEVRRRTVRLDTDERAQHAQAERVVIGVIGAGNYATQVLIPAFSQTPALLASVASAAGVSGFHAAKKFRIAETTTDSNEIIANTEINTVVITTRHNSHADFVCQALEAGKHVFVEKPLALTRDELNQIEEAYSAQAKKGGAPLLMVGFNRRFAPHVQKIKDLIENVGEPKSFVMTVNAGEIPPDHWTQDRAVGGGRIIGEGCHFIDLLRFLADAPIASTQAMMMGQADGVSIRDDKVTISLSFQDCSFGTVHYLANGHKGFPKERLEVFCAGGILQLDNFRSLRGYGWPGFNKMNLWRQNKGNAACVTAFVDAIQHGKVSPIPIDQIAEVTRVTFDIVEKLG